MARLAWSFAGLLLACLALVGCGQARQGVAEDRPAGPPWFHDITEASGVTWVHDAGPTGDYFMPQCVGSGAALYDFDGDGRLDLYLLHNGGARGKANQLFAGRDGGTFRDASAGSGLDFAGHCMGAAVGDFNNDGRPDLLVTLYTGARLFLNEGGLCFRDVTRQAGLDNPLWSASAAFADVDGDGWLDLVIVNYVDYDPSWPCAGAAGPRDFCAPRVFRGTASKLFRNRTGRDGRPSFEDVTVASGLASRAGPGLGVVIGDLAGNRRQDLFIANDGAANHLWVNQGDGTFQEEGVSRGAGFTVMGAAMAGMGIAVGDVDGDGLLDLYVTHLTSETNTLWKQGPAGLFRDESAAWGLTGTRWRGTGFGTVAADFDRDGRPDLALVNGRVQRGSRAPDEGLGPFWREYGERNQLLANDGSSFRDISDDSPDLCGRSNVGRGLCVGDLDGDGALDLVVTSVAGPVRLLGNVAPRRGNWAVVRALEGRRDALGALVTLRAGERRWVRLVTSAHGFLCASPADAHFGLGDRDRFDAVEITWADGSRETFPGGSAGTVVTLRKGEGR